jgi:hypothetical protein
VEEREKGEEEGNRSKLLDNNKEKDMDNKDNKEKR